MWAHIQESPNPVVRAAHDDDGFARNGHGPEIEWFGNFRLVHGNEPYSFPDLLNLFLENALIAVDSAVDIRNRLTAIVGGLLHLRRHDNSPLRASTRNRNLRSSVPGLSLAAKRETFAILAVPGFTTKIDSMHIAIGRVYRASAGGPPIYVNYQTIWAASG